MLKDMVSSMISHSSLPESLWGEAFTTPAYILNMVTNYGLERSIVLGIYTFGVV